MDVITALTGIGSAFGLSASAGLNAYIPLLTVALAARFTDLINLNGPYDLLASWPAITLLTILLTVEFFVDKIPAVDTANDLIQSFVRPTAGAVLFAASTNTVDIAPVVAVLAGILLAGTVHVTKSAARPVVTAGTAGTGNWAVSIMEDVVAFGISILAMIVPILVGVLVLAIIFFAVRFWMKRRRKRGYSG